MLLTKKRELTVPMVTELRSMSSIVYMSFMSSFEEFKKMLYITRLNLDIFQSSTFMLLRNLQHFQKFNGKNSTF